MPASRYLRTPLLLPGALLALLLTAPTPFASCTRANPSYCRSDSDCVDPFPFCDLATSGCIGAPPDGGENHQVVYVEAVACPGKGEGTWAKPFCSIEDAIALVAQDGTISVADGEYTVDLEISGMSFTLEGRDDPRLEISECPGVHVRNGAVVTIKGFEITGATSEEGGGAVQVTGNSSASILENHIHANTCIGVRCIGADCKIERNRILDNDLGGIEILDSRFDIINNIISENGGAGQIGGVWIDRAGDSTFVNNTVAYNNARAAIDAGRSPDNAHALRYLDVAKRVSCQVPILTDDAARHAARVRFVRFEDDETSREADEGG